MRLAVIAGLALFATVDLSPARANDMPADVSVKGEFARVFMFLGDRLRENRGAGRRLPTRNARLGQGARSRREIEIKLTPRRRAKLRAPV